MGPGGEASIDYEKCISCGTCVYHCPFERQLTYPASWTSSTPSRRALARMRTIRRLPSWRRLSPASSYTLIWDRSSQVSKKLGFAQVLEVALGADMVATKEAQELVEKGFLTSSCCPAFVKYIETKYPGLKEKISHNFSPMVELAKFIKEGHPEATIVFIGPCIAKKAEVRKPEVRKYIDYTITFEESCRPSLTAEILFCVNRKRQNGTRRPIMEEFSPSQADLPRQ